MCGGACLAASLLCCLYCADGVGAACNYSYRVGMLAVVVADCTVWFELKEVTPFLLTKLVSVCFRKHSEKRSEACQHSRRPGQSRSALTHLSAADAEALSVSLKLRFQLFCQGAVVVGTLREMFSSDKMQSFSSGNAWSGPLLFGGQMSLRFSLHRAI